jgi:hypothetical protein
MFTPFQPAALRTLVQNTLNPLGIWSADAEELLLATCAQESLFGTYRTQGGGGPARGIFQMEGGDFNDIWKNYEAYHPAQATAVKALNGGNVGTVDDLVNNDPYAVALARVHYQRCPRALPSNTDLNALWMYYKVNYNSVNGAATISQFYRNYHKYVTDGTAS